MPTSGYQERAAELAPYLAASPIIDWTHPVVLAQARALTAGLNDDEAIACACFVFVRDAIRHSWDAQANPVTCTASEVLAHRIGYCYGKSHLLAALLRANGLPTALCYQRLSVDDNGPPYCLHGLNAVYLARHGWYRLDARGNKPGVAAEFCPPREALAFALRLSGEVDVPGRFAEPLAAVVQALTTHDDYRVVATQLPDWPLADLPA